MNGKSTVCALRFREAIRCALGACDCTIESVAMRCGTSRQVIDNMLKGRNKTRSGTARLVMEVMTDELRGEITAEHERIAMLEQLITNIKNTYDREYAEVGKPNELSDL